LDDEHVNESQLKRANKRFKFVPWQVIYKKGMNDDESKSEVKVCKRVKRLVSGDEEKAKQLEKLGIKYEFRSYGDMC